MGDARLYWSRHLQTARPATTGRLKSSPESDKSASSAHSDYSEYGTRHKTRLVRVIAHDAPAKRNITPAPVAQCIAGYGGEVPPYCGELGSRHMVIRVDLSPKFHPAISRARSTFEPSWLGDATGWGAKPPVERSAPSRCISGSLSLA